MRTRHRRVLSLLLAFALMLLGVGPASALTGTPSPTWGVDGRVYAVAVVGDTIYVGGSFSNAVSPSGALVARQRLAAFSLTTGELRSGFRADAGSTVMALASDGQRLYVGGHFGRIQGVSRSRLAAINVSTGLVDGGFRADANGGVLALDVAAGHLYVGGDFNTIGGVQRVRLAKLSPTTGAVDGTFRANANVKVQDVQKHPSADVLYVSGNFSALNGIARAGVGAVSSVNGATVGPAFTGSVRPTLELDVNHDGTMLYGALAAGSNSATAWNTSTGARVWRQTAMGDVQAVEYFDGVLYFGFHEGFGGDTSVKLLAADARTGAINHSFRPAINRWWGIFEIAATNAGLVVGGEFTRVEGVTANNLARFMGYPGP